ncbi:MAG: hypothetical protein K0U60_07710, partial [Actinomycetia bacterium]|nr:hypothetical protein [Actinomycetes bacterium]
MKRISRHKRATAAIIGAGAVAAAAVLPGSLATAETTGEVYTDITRAVLIQGDADAEVYRQTLVTQINVEGNGNANFSV